MPSEVDEDALASAPAPLLHRRSLEGETWRRRAPAAVVAAAPRGSTEGGVAWTRYPLIDGLELHVRGDFADVGVTNPAELLAYVAGARTAAGVATSFVAVGKKPDRALLRVLADAGGGATSKTRLSPPGARWRAGGRASQPPPTTRRQAGSRGRATRGRASRWSPAT